MPRGLKGPKHRLDLQDRHRHRAEANDPSFISGATAAQSVVEKAATPRPPCLGKRGKDRRFACGVPAHLYRDPTALWWCVPGGTGRPWVAFFLTMLCSSLLWCRCIKQPGGLERVALLLCGCCQKHSVLGFACVVGPRQARCLSPFVQSLITPITNSRGGPDAAYCFKSERNGIRKICGVQHGNLHLSTQS